MCVALIVTLGYGLITTPSRINELIFIWLFLVAASLVATNYLTWQIKGQEILTFTDDYIELKNTGTLFTRLTKIDFTEAEQIVCDQDKQTPRWIHFWGIGGGKIRIEYLGRNRRYGQDLTIQEATSMIEQMQVEFDKRKTAQKPID